MIFIGRTMLKLHVRLENEVLSPGVLRAHIFLIKIYVKEIEIVGTNNIVEKNVASSKELLCRSIK